MFSPIPSVKGVKSDDQWIMCESHAVLLQVFLPILPSSSLSVHGGMLEEYGSSWGKR